MWICFTIRAGFPFGHSPRMNRQSGGGKGFPVQATGRGDVGDAGVWLTVLLQGTDYLRAFRPGEI